MRTWLSGLVLISLLLASASCVTVRPQQRAILADPIMQFEGDPHANAPIRHALDNREGSFGGDGVSGGGCGCN
jgi:hypothetical protein